MIEPNFTLFLSLLLIWYIVKGFFLILFACLGIEKKRRSHFDGFDAFDGFLHLLVVLAVVIL